VSQNYFANGDAKNTGGDCYSLTPDVNWKLGSVWYADQIDLSKDFDLEFDLNFGAKDVGADGIVFVLQNVGNRAIGLAGGGLGFDGFSPSLGIEFDTYQNSNIGDPAQDHIAIFKNGTVDHYGSTALSGHVQAHKTKSNIEDGENHQIRVKWEVAIQTLEVWFDCELRQSVSLDIQEEIFEGKSKVYWGFTAATGGLSNQQTACLRKDIIAQDTFAVCKGDRTRLNVRKSFDDKYLWTPSRFLDDTSVKRPFCSSTIPMTYYAQYTDLCGEKVLDTIEVEVHQPFIMDEGDDTLLCSPQILRYDFRTKYDSVLWGDQSRTPVRVINDSGEIKLRAWKGVCYDDDSFYVSTNFKPRLSLDGDSVFCNSDSTEIILSLEPRDADYAWHDNELGLNRFFKATSSLWVEAENACGKTRTDFGVRKVEFENLFIVGDSILCEDATINLSSSVKGNYQYKWRSGESGISISTESAGDYSVSVYDQQCYVEASKTIIDLVTPRLDLPSELLLCEFEKITLFDNVEDAPVFWDGLRADSIVLLNFEGMLDVRTSNFCGSDSTQVDITLKECLCDLIFPNAITPNQDGLNDVFRPFVDCDKLKSYELSIYNRWGQRIFFTKDIESPIPNGEDVLTIPGIYTWLTKYSGIENGMEMIRNESGILHVLR